LGYSVAHSHGVELDYNILAPFCHVYSTRLRIGTFFGGIGIIYCLCEVSFRRRWTLFPRALFSRVDLQPHWATAAKLSTIFLQFDASFRKLYYSWDAKLPTILLQFDASFRSTVATALHVFHG
jgi:hypothetical protein